MPDTPVHLRRLPTFGAGFTRFKTGSHNRIAILIRLAWTHAIWRHGVCSITGGRALANEDTSL